ncbi:MAG: protein-L-isoaspartate(D-aspartate) O-methyltransferase [Pseudomonadota bacterium]
MSTDPFAEHRQRMLAGIAAKTIYACAQLGRAALRPRVLDALASVPRHEFVPTSMQGYAYEDSPLPIGCGKTISQPFIVAVMTDLLDVQATDTVLEVGTGLGYQTAVLAALARRVDSIELIEELAVQAIHRLARQRCTNVDVRVGDGSAGWPAHAPYDKVIVTAAPAAIPPALVAQLKPGGRMVLPAGPPEDQQLIVLDKALDGSTSTRAIFAVRFSLLA